MNDAALLRRIQRSPHVVSGRPTVRGLRITVDHVVGMRVAGMTPRQIIDQHPELEEEDIAACIVWARRFLSEAIRRLENAEGPDAVKAMTAEWTETEERLLAMALRLSQPVLLDLIPTHEPVSP